MLRDEQIEICEYEWVPDAETPGETDDWKDVDRALCDIAKRRSALDAEELRWLRQALRFQVWREVGSASFLEYLEKRLGYGPNVAFERIRVAKALEELPVLADALENNELKFSAVRELTRIATPDTELDWLDASRGKTVRQIESLMSGHKRGNRPTDPTDPDLKLRLVQLKLKPETVARLRQARQTLEQERGGRLEDDEFYAAMANAAIESGEPREINGRAKFQIATIECKCGRGWQEGAGVRVDIDASALARAKCDAQNIGSLDHQGPPERATQEVSPAKRRKVYRRDGGRCCVPGSRSARFLEIHHIVARENGGSHQLSNLTLACDGHHRNLHDGKLTITGTAPDKLVFRWKHEPPRFDADARHVRVDPDNTEGQAISALVNAGCKTREAKAAVDAAILHVGSGAPLEKLVFEAFRRCV
ncbi:MAG: endonuclease [Myxococcales bacterium]|nr:endonuclease [Myxococcales bacterium]